MPEPLISVIIPARNAAKFIREAVDSALAQTHRPIEVICINDGSTDGTAKVLAGYGERIRVVENGKSMGVSVARNRGIAIARGEWIAFLDADDVWDPNKLAIQLAAAESGVDVIHSNARYIDENGVARRQSVREGRQIGALKLVDLLEGNQVIMSTAMARRLDIIRVGGFNPNCPPAEDWNLWLSLAATQHRFFYINQILASYRIHQTNASLNLMKMTVGELNSLKQVRKRHSRAFHSQERWRYQAQLSSFHGKIALMNFERNNRTKFCAHSVLSKLHQPHSIKAWITCLRNTFNIKKQKDE